MVSCCCSIGNRILFLAEEQLLLDSSQTGENLGVTASFFFPGGEGGLGQ